MFLVLRSSKFPEFSMRIASQITCSNGIAVSPDCGQNKELRCENNESQKVT